MQSTVATDALWKGIIEDLFSDFLLYFYPNWSIENVDFQKGFEFLDKELETIYPQRKGKRFADKLVKIPLLSGKEQWFLIHIEVQDYEDKNFPERMFQYFYRIRDRYEKDVMALAIFTDGNKEFHPKKYEYTFQKTRVEYHFDTFKIVEKSESELSIAQNIFSIVMLVGKKALEKNKSNINKDKAILTWKIALVKELMKGGYEQEKIRKVMKFIQFFVNFKSKEVVKEYEEELSKIIKTRTNMGIEQTIIEHFKEEGRQEGIQKGEQIGIQKGEQIGIQKGEQIGIQKGEQIGIQKGKLEGEYLKAIKMAEKCLLKGMNIYDIVELTELPLKTVQELATSLGR
jgi:predicted transposase YdaD